MYKGCEPRRGGPNGAWCLGNNESDGLSYIANWNGRSTGCATKAEADAMVQRMRREENNKDYYSV